MRFYDEFRTEIKSIVQIEIQEQLNSLKKDLAEVFHEKGNCFPNTRYLSPNQVLKYIGKKSKTGLKELLAERDIHPITLNPRVVRYDREEIDSKLTMQDCVEQYLNAWK